MCLKRLFRKSSFEREVRRDLQLIIYELTGKDSILMSNLTTLQDTLAAVSTKTDAVLSLLKDLQAKGAGSISDDDLAGAVAQAQDILGKETAAVPDAPAA